MINCIVAVDKNQGIGYKNSLPWPRLTADMQFFKKITTNQVVIMGSSTWLSLPKKLPDRINIVISRFNQLNADHCFSAIEPAIVYSQIEYPDKEIFIIGGQKIYDSTMHLIDKFFVTEINQEFLCDKFFNLTYVKEKSSRCLTLYKNTQDIEYTINEYLK